MSRAKKNYLARSLGLGMLGVAAFVVTKLATEQTVRADSVPAGDVKSELLSIAKSRSLSTQDMVAAVSTYTNAKQKDEFVCLNSGGQAGSVIVYAVPSMRILKYIPTAAPDSAAGYNFDEQSKSVLKQGFIDDRTITWGDTHHPSFSETNGRYDGQYAFINDKANPRVFVMDLKDFETKQIVQNPLFRSDHGGAFVTPNTEYVVEAAQYPAPLDRKYRPLNQANFNAHWRGGVTYHRFDREKGRIDPERSFTVVAPPYWQDLSDAGKGESFGFSFTNSLCSERYVGGIEQGRPPYEAGCSARDTDFLHVIDWKKAEAVVAAGKATKINGHWTIPLELSVQEGLLYLIPEAKSPHGVDVSPDGRYIVVAGKLDTHAQVFDIQKIKALIEAKDFMDKDPYGIPILDHKKALHGQVQLGLGPLHTQFSNEDGVAYTSVYIDSVVVRWNFKELKVIDKQSVHYNIGHLVSMQGDSQDPRGKYVIALNKLAIDRFAPVGPLHPQNHQLVDVSGQKMQLLYDMPLPMGEPHYTVCIDATTLKPLETYPVGTNSATMEPAPFATKAGEERVEKKAGRVDVFATLSDKGLTPARVDANQGDVVSLHVTNLLNEAGQTVELSVGGYGALGIYPPGRAATVEFTATQGGFFPVRVERVDRTTDARRFALLSVKPNPGFEKKRKSAYQLEQAAAARLASWAVQQKEEGMTAGEAAFAQFGCAGCHQKGRELGGPDLTDVVVRRDEAWLASWIVDPEAKYEEPYIKAMIERYGVKMPKQGVSEAQAREIIGYLKTWRSDTAPVAEGASEGQKAYGKVCFACHDQGVAGAPKLGDKALWGPRLPQGEATLFQHVLEGYKGQVGFMPPRGGCGDCTDDQLKAAMEYMVSKVK